VLPGELLQELGVRSEPAEIAVTVLALLSLTWGGFVAFAKFLAWSRRRLRLRDSEEKRRLRRRQLFATFVENRVRDLNRREEWSDFRFAELEAEVETVGNGRRRGPGRLFGRQRGLRRERSLSNALVKSRERLILLRGDPGSGKSVALRFVTQKMAMKATRARRTDAVIPLYINLKDLRTEARKVDARLIEDFVLESLRRGGDREVHSFLDEEFSPGKAVGGWFFLFDSFDEIPEVLSSTEDDETVRAYSSAISSFVEGMHTCRGVIASRHFRAPQEAGLPTFRIVPLSESRKLELIDKAEIGDAKVQLVAHLRNLPSELATLSSNPLFLGLLAEYVRDRKTLPEGWHDVFEAFVSRRLKTDRERVVQLFHISSETLRCRSEEIAFTMTAADNFGLSPTREDLETAYVQAGFSATTDLDAALNALAWIKLARSDGEVTKSGEETFTFAHRRFQEYFATCVVLREPDRISARTLLTDASWRETAVTLCHAQPHHTEALVAEADALLAEVEPTGDDADFSWHPGILHLLGLLQSAFAGRTQGLTAGLRQRVAVILDDVQNRGTITDRKWALEVAGTAPAEDMAGLLLGAFRGPSEWLREAAYRQVARLAKIPPNIATEIRGALIEKAARRELQRDWASTRAQLLRLRPSEPFVRTARLLRVAPVIDAGVFIGGYVVATMTFEPSLATAVGWALVVALAHLCYYRVAVAIAKANRDFPLASSDLREFLLNLGAIGVRLGVAVIPLVLSIAPQLAGDYTLGLVPEADLEQGKTLVPAAVWLYASTWSIAATVLALRKAPGVVSWPLLPLRLAWNEVWNEIRLTWAYLIRVRPTRDRLTKIRPTRDRLTRAVDIRRIPVSTLASLISGAAFVVVCIALAALIGALSKWVPSIVWVVLGALLAAVFLLILLASGGVLAWVWFVDRHTRRRLLGPHRTNVTAPELLTCLASMEMSTSATWTLREVRTRRLLDEDAEAALVMRDLLRAIERPMSGGHMEEARWKSPAFVSWLEDGGKVQLRRLKSFGHGFYDELGPLLEELERGEESPFA
jgi:hypothetical protein